MNQVDQDKIIRFLQERMPLKLLILFGSYAKGENTVDSDIDIDLAFITEPKISNVERWEIAQELAIMLDRDIDLVNLERASEVFRFQIVSQGEVLFSEGSYDAYLDRAYTMYFQLNEDRKEILEHYEADNRRCE
ncbi:type VII toxin-antitoxin system MntA family adenylyltransferase antitoxin [Fangia hongkongensis]|uniref:type VII toxin-antitoxin system MntA family adenylyltransferase antitoxin n=1 Tax=Fangia hongkongensis TaxID=270495 RepID=UPI000376CDEE|nr:nucleotidyltransferase domain-containing protein [Fangia hongkongensis]MBK2124762.1 nucleotidyltransferase domain-containing protein [Fangia hongkongensis]